MDKSTSLYEFVLAHLRSGESTYQQISDGTGISRRTIEKIARQEIENPGVRNVETLATWFRERHAQTVPAR